MSRSGFIDMTRQRIGILHPGEMGISIAASAQQSGHHVYWASEGRSATTHARAAKFGLRDTRTVAHLCAACSILVSVCPPHAAEAVANQVVAHSFSGSIWMRMRLRHSGPFALATP
ncbi:MAG: NAD(P)-binding domain-containing protein [Gammaproteobacteria bacterium]